MNLENPFPNSQNAIIRILAPFLATHSRWLTLNGFQLQLKICKKNDKNIKKSCKTNYK